MQQTRLTSARPTEFPFWKSIRSIDREGLAADDAVLIIVAHELRFGELVIAVVERFENAAREAAGHGQSGGFEGELFGGAHMNALVLKLTITSAARIGKPERFNSASNS